jgi:hypothetical protein
VGAFEQAAADENPCSPAEPPTDEKKRNPAAAAPSGLCPAEVTGDGKGGGGRWKGPAELGIGTARVK